MVERLKPARMILCMLPLPVSIGKHRNTHSHLNDTRIIFLHLTKVTEDQAVWTPRQWWPLELAQRMEDGSSKKLVEEVDETGEAN